LGIGDCGLGPIPNPKSPIPNPQSTNPKNKKTTKILNKYYSQKIIYNEKFNYFFINGI
jgi:hypothetical protein